MKFDKHQIVNFIYFILGAVLVFVWFKIFESEQKPVVILTKDHIIRDSIYIVNDSIKKEYIYIAKEINKQKDSILNNTDSANLVFFSNYLKECENY
jgi:hypothetical protein